MSSFLCLTWSSQSNYDWSTYSILSLVRGRRNVFKLTSSYQPGKTNVEQTVDTSLPRHFLTCPPLFHVPRSSQGLQVTVHILLLHPKVERIPRVTPSSHPGGVSHGICRVHHGYLLYFFLPKPQLVSFHWSCTCKLL